MRLNVILLAQLAFASAFSPAASTVSRSTAKCKPALTTMHAEGLVVTAIRHTVALPTMYALLSAHEYMTHRYLMHLGDRRSLKKWITQALRIDRLAAEDNGHMEHHAETLDNMGLRNDTRWRLSPASVALDHDQFRGTAFNWQNYAIVALTMPIYVVPVFALMGWSLEQTMAIFLPSVLLHMLVWNALHPPMHGMPFVPAHVGPPSWVLAGFLRRGRIGRWLYLNHAGHHVLRGKANYNVVCPLADHLFGTYVPPERWMGEMQLTPEGQSIRGPVVAPKGVPDSLQPQGLQG